MAARKKNGGETAGNTEKETQTVEVPAEDVTAVKEDGTETPLTEAIPGLKGQTVEAEIPKEPEAAAQAGGKEAETPPVVYQVVAPKDPMVKILYLDSCIPTNQIPIGGGRVITGTNKIFSVTLTEFEGTFQTPLIMQLLKLRKFIVLDGLTDEQRQQYGVDYAEGEIIKNEGMFDYMLNCPVSQAAEIFMALCPSHREMVAARVHEAWERGDKRLSRERVEALNDISKADFDDGRGAFTDILKAMNEARI